MMGDEFGLGRRYRRELATQGIATDAERHAGLFAWQPLSQCDLAHTYSNVPKYHWKCPAAWYLLAVVGFLFIGRGPWDRCSRISD